VEALADMTPEQLEAIEGIGPKTVEKISLAVNNYFASLEGVAAEGEVSAEGVVEGEAVSMEATAEGSVEGDALAEPDVEAGGEANGAEEAPLEAAAPESSSEATSGEEAETIAPPESEDQQVKDLEVKE
jgi:N utilization substance protein A